MESLFLERSLDLLFPTPVYTVKIDKQLCEEAGKFILQKINSNALMKQMLDETGGSTTNDDLHLETSLESIFDIISNEVKIYSELHLGVKPNSLKLTCSWSNVHTSGFRHIMHCHPNSTLSGVLYLTVPDSDFKGNLIFSDPRPGKRMVEMDFTNESYIYNRMHSYTPEVGKMIIFPSWLEHGTELFRGEGHRISLSFNYNLISCERHSYRV